eukprot:scaffold34139_cov45-Attheya_sp.AAC.4
MRNIATGLLLLVHGSSAFTTAPPQQASTTALSMGAEERRGFLSRVGWTSAAAAFGLVNTVAEPANAFGGGGLEKANAKLSGYGLPPLGKTPDGFSPLVQFYGKGKNRNPLLVEFIHPIDWVVVLPNNDQNGEDGTIQAGDYGKGDTATLYVNGDKGKVDDISSQSKDFFQEAIIKAISQKGNNVYQNFKVTKVEQTTGEYKSQKYAIVDFKYELLTGAGFEVDRIGVASVTSVGDSVQVLWTASTRQRYKKLEEKLRTTARSFRCFSDGLDLAGERVVYDTSM